MSGVCIFDVVFITYEIEPVDYLEFTFVRDEHLQNIQAQKQQDQPQSTQPSNGFFDDPHTLVDSCLWRLFIRCRSST
jgi:hypothetical protein